MSDDRQMTWQELADENAALKGQLADARREIEQLKREFESEIVAWNEKAEFYKSEMEKMGREIGQELVADRPDAAVEISEPGVTEATGPYDPEKHRDVVPYSFNRGYFAGIAYAREHARIVPGKDGGGA